MSSSVLSELVTLASPQADDKETGVLLIGGGTPEMVSVTSTGSSRAHSEKEERARD